jgi:transposase
MVMTPADLPDSVADLRALVLSQQTQVDAYAEEISQLREYVRLLKSQHFGPRSERTSPDQMGLFNEAEVEAEDAPDLLDDDEEEGAESGDGEGDSDKPRRKGGRRPLPAFLPREEILHDLCDEEKVCPHDSNHRLVEIGRETSEQLKFIPASAIVIRNIRPKYACPTCKEGIQIAPMPPQPIPKSMATPSLLAQVAGSKYVDGLPLYRQEKILARIGIDITRATLASWMIHMGERVDPLIELMLMEIQHSDFVQADETRFQVLKEDGKAATSESYLWALRAALPAHPLHPLLVFTYDPTRSGDVPERLLKGFQGFLQTDGYSGYTALGKMAGVEHVGCFAHARRKFTDALRGQGKNGSKSTKKSSLARQGLQQINGLYRIERSCREVPAEERYAIRQKKTKPRLEELRKWLDASIDKVPPGSLTGRAMTYLDNQWPKLMRVLDDGRLPLDTNWVENAIRPFVVGRKGWLFADTPKGAKASANLYSLVETAKANGLEPRAYLEKIFEMLPAAETPADLEALLPWRIESPKSARIPLPTTDPVSGRPPDPHASSAPAASS